LLIANLINGAVANDLPGPSTQKTTKKAVLNNRKRWEENLEVNKV
jgi:hypothetical protein